jgi:aerobic C4-dicarboxylate transport protein
MSSSRARAEHRSRHPGPSAVAKYSEQAHETTIVGFLTGIIPDTVVVAPFAEGNILQVLFVSILFGMALAMVGDVGKPVLNFLESISHAFFKLVAILMKAAPIGAFGAFAFTIGKYGIGSIANLAALVATFYITAIVFVVGVLGAGGLGQRLQHPQADPLPEGRIAAGARHLVVGSRPAVAARTRWNAPAPQVGGRPGRADRLFVQSGRHQHLHDHGGPVHRPGAEHRPDAATADPAAAGRHVESKGAAGITGAGFITLAATLSVVPSVPVAGMALILGIDRFMSECRALTNFIGNAVATIVVARWEGELDRDALHAALNGPAQPIAARPDPAAGPGDKDLVTAD